MHATFDVDAGVNTEHVAARWNWIIPDVRVAGRKWVRNEQPWMVKSRVLRIKLLSLTLYLRKRVLRRPRPVENRESIAHQLAMVDQRILYCYVGSTGTGNNADLFNIPQA